MPHGMKMDVFVKGVKKRVVLRGNNSSLVVGGFGLTENVEKDFIDQWLKENANLECVQKGLIWYYKDTPGAHKRALEEAEKRHGMEQLVVDGKDKDPRIPGRVKTDEGKDD